MSNTLVNAVYYIALHFRGVQVLHFPQIEIPIKVMLFEVIHLVFICNGRNCSTRVQDCLFMKAEDIAVC